MRWDRVERLLGSENLARLGRSRVVIAGLGSGGGFVALTLAMSGVGHFVLVDNDALEEANFVRHVADRRYLGWNKAAAVADLIKHRNPDAQVQVIEDKIEHHLHLLDEADLLIVGVDNENTKYILNEACVERDLTAIYAGVYERGEGGDVVRIDPGNGPCYACWAAELREGLFQPTASENLDYGMINEQGTLNAEPGLYVQVAKVAAIQTDFALTELLKGVRPPYPTNTIIIANAAMEIVEGEPSPPHSSLWVDVPRDPHCLVCGELINRDEFDETQKFSLSDLAGSAGLTIESGQS